MDEKQIKVMLMFGTDAAKAEAELLKLQKLFSQLGQRTKTLRKELDVFKATKQDSQALEKELFQSTLPMKGATHDWATGEIISGFNPRSQ